MTMRRPSPSRRRRVPTTRRRTQWDGSVVAPATVGPGVRSFSLLNMPRGLGERMGLTVARVIGSLRVNSTDASLSVDFEAGFKMLSEEEAVTVPSPTGDLDADWLWWHHSSALPQV